MSVIAKFRVNEVTATSKAREVEVNGQQRREATGRLKLGAVYESAENPDANPEDVAFSLATPSGTIEMSVTNADALEQFQPGDEFYVRFDKVE